MFVFWLIIIHSYCHRQDRKKKQQKNLVESSVSFSLIETYERFIARYRLFVGALKFDFAFLSTNENRCFNIIDREVEWEKKYIQLTPLQLFTFSCSFAHFLSISRFFFLSIFVWKNIVRGDDCTLATANISSLSEDEYISFLCIYNVRRCMARKFIFTI